MFSPHVTIYLTWCLCFGKLMEVRTNLVRKQFCDGELMAEPVAGVKSYSF